jgi:UDP-glucose 4-epimerase
VAVLVTGGAGYIGSHTSIVLIESGYDIVIFDNFSNSSKESVRRVEKIVNRKIPLVEGDIRDKEALREVFRKYRIDAVIHFAGLKAVGESVEKPLEYYDNNVVGTIRLCEVMREFNCKSIIFSSSATVYGDPKSVPIKEDFPTSATNPYGRTKLFIEEILKDIYISDSSWRVVILRYFNPVGAYESGDIGEDPNGIPNNLMPFISQVAVGKRDYLRVFGDDYPTHDGTGVRDYIHVMDLAEGHVKALDKINEFDRVMIFNLGTGKGYSVLDIIKAYEMASHRDIPYKIVSRRDGDIARNYADSTLAKEVLGWEAKRDLNQMCQDSWRWQSKNPDGYRS